MFTSELPKPVEEPEVVESEVTIEITAPEEPEPVAPVWVQVYDDLVSTCLVYIPVIVVVTVTMFNFKRIYAWQI